MGMKYVKFVSENEKQSHNMKIVVGKFSSEPFHGLSNKEVETLIKLVPEDWTKDIKSVHLSAKICRHKGRDRSVVFSSSSGKLEIMSRGFDMQDIAKEVLYTLSHLGGETEGKPLGKVTPAQLSVLDEAISPYLHRFMGNDNKRAIKAGKIRR